MSAVAELRAGAAAVLPLLVGAVPFGLVLGALAAQKGLGPLEVALMSGLVFAGGSQFLAVELWREPVPVLLLIAMAALVNARHILMGAAFAPRLAGVPAGRLWPALFFLTDETWAMTLAGQRRGMAALSWFLGLSVMLWLGWVASTLCGAILGATIADPTRYGLDFAFIAVFLVLIRGLWRGRTSLVPWLASAAAAALIAALWPGPWYVAGGALAGMLAAALMPLPAPAGADPTTGTAHAGADPTTGTAHAGSGLRETVR